MTRQQRWRKAHREQGNAASRSWHERNRAKILPRMREYGRKRYAANRDVIRREETARRRKNREAARRRAKRCAICKCPLVKFVFDHCHRTAMQRCAHVSRNSCTRCRRDVLCPKCNTSLGGFKDSLKLLQAAQRYLKKWNRRLHV